VQRPQDIADVLGASRAYNTKRELLLPCGAVLRYVLLTATAQHGHHGCVLDVLLLLAGNTTPDVSFCVASTPIMKGQMGYRYTVSGSSGPSAWISGSGGFVAPPASFGALIYNISTLRDALMLEVWVHA